MLAKSMDILPPKITIYNIISLTNPASQVRHHSKEYLERPSSCSDVFPNLSDKDP